MEKLWPRCKEEAARSSEKALVSSAAGNNGNKSKKGRLHPRMCLGYYKPQGKSQRLFCDHDAGFLGKECFRRIACPGTRDLYIVQIQEPAQRK